MFVSKESQLLYILSKMLVFSVIKCVLQSEKQTRCENPEVYHSRSNFWSGLHEEWTSKLVTLCHKQCLVLNQTPRIPLKLSAKRAKYYNSKSNYSHFATKETVFESKGPYSKEINWSIVCMNTLLKCRKIIKVSANLFRKLFSNWLGSFGKVCCLA